MLIITERYLDGRVSRVRTTGNGPGGYESIDHLRALARSRGWRQVRDIEGGVQRLTEGVLSDGTSGPMLVDVVLQDHICARDNQGLCHGCGEEVES